MKVLLILLGLSSVALAQLSRGRTGRDETTTPVPILRQINTVNEDGSYTYGYEGADGSYKIENKAKNGEVSGKYGYYDDQGSLREIEYGASRLGFNPRGTGIRSPVLPDHVNALGPDQSDGDDGSYDAARYERPYDYLNAQNPNPQQAQQPRRTRPRGGRRLNDAPQQQQQYQQQQQQYQQPQYQQQQQQPQYQQPQNQQPQYQQPQQPQQHYQQQQQQQYQPRQQQNLFHGHPARNIDINTGSYSVNY